MESLPVGPFGGSRGSAWNYKPNGTITQIVIAHSTSIGSITFKHKTDNGLLESSNKFGGNGCKIDTININNPSEYLTSISGTFGVDSWGTVVRSLRVVTNLKSYGPFGVEEGTPFSSATPEHVVIVGFLGRSGLVLDAIGVYVKPKPLTVGVGPWGGSGGSEWDYQPKGVIRKIVINHGQLIDSIMFQQDNGNGTVEDSQRFGGTGGNRTEIDINSPSEYITQISGSYDTVVTSLRFVTNLKVSGPYGSPGRGTPFSLPIKEGATVVGFHGRAGNYIDSIGFYLKPK